MNPMDLVAFFKSIVKNVFLSAIGPVGAVFDFYEVLSSFEIIGECADATSECAQLNVTNSGVTEVLTDAALNQLKRSAFDRFRIQKTASGLYVASPAAGEFTIASASVLSLSASKALRLQPSKSLHLEGSTKLTFD